MRSRLASEWSTGFRRPPQLQGEMVEQEPVTADYSGPEIETRHDCGCGVTGGQAAGTAEATPWLMPSEYAAAGLRWITKMADSMSAAIHPLLGQVSRSEARELPLPQDRDAPRPDEASPLFRSVQLSHYWTTSVEGVVHFDRDSFLSDLYALADSLGSQRVKALLEHISEVVESNGNSIDGAGRDFYEVAAEALETIDMSFNEDGTPNLSFVMHPDQIDELRNRPPTPEQEARFNEILERRREEWFAARRRRELP